MNTAFVEMVEGVEPFYGIFVNTLNDLQTEGISNKERWRALRVWMSFMREYVEEFIQRWPHLLSELACWLMRTIEKGKGGENYQENARAILEIIEPHLPQEDEETEEEDETDV